jgi:hypothetical protein
MNNSKPVFMLRLILFLSILITGFVLALPGDAYAPGVWHYPHTGTDVNASAADAGAADTGAANADANRTTTAATAYRPSDTGDGDLPNTRAPQFSPRDRQWAVVKSIIALYRWRALGVERGVSLAVARRCQTSCAIIILP